MLEIEAKTEKSEAKSIDNINQSIYNNKAYVYD